MYLDLGNIANITSKIDILEIVQYSNMIKVV